VRRFAAAIDVTAVDVLQLDHALRVDEPGGAHDQRAQPGAVDIIDKLHVQNEFGFLQPGEFLECGTKE
jgi:hypothetical protein